MSSQCLLKGFHSKQVLQEHSVVFRCFSCTMKFSNSYVMWHQCVTRPKLAGDLTHAICFCAPLFSPSSPLPFQRFYKVVREYVPSCGSVGMSSVPWEAIKEYSMELWAWEESSVEMQWRNTVYCETNVWNNHIRELLHVWIKLTPEREMIMADILACTKSLSVSEISWEVT